jgi:hypothetical protein
LNDLPVDRITPTDETDSKPGMVDGLTGIASPATQAAPLSDDQRSWQTDTESTLVSDTKQVFARDQALPITFHVLPGSSELSAETMIVVSPVIVPIPRATQTVPRRWGNRTSRPSFYACRPDCLQYIRSMDIYGWISSYGTAWEDSRVFCYRQTGQLPGLRGEE